MRQFPHSGSGRPTTSGPTGESRAQTAQTRARAGDVRASTGSRWEPTRLCRGRAAARGDGSGLADGTFMQRLSSSSRRVTSYRREPGACTCL